MPKVNLEIVKRNLLSIICGVVALLAVAVVFFFIDGLFEELGTDLAKSKDTYGQLKQLNSEKGGFLMPTTGENQAEATPLPHFPTERQIIEGENIVKLMHEQAAKVQKTAREINEKQALYEGAFRGSVPARFEFKRRYWAKFDEFKKRLNATRAPLMLDMNAEKDRLWEEVWKKRIVVGAGGQAGNEAEVRADFENKVVPFLPDQMRLDWAERHSVYYIGNPPNAPVPDRSFDYHFPGIPPLTSREMPDVVDIWIAQLSLWIQEDVVEAIVLANNAPGLPRSKYGNVSVSNAVVKRLIKIEIPREYVHNKGKMSLMNAQNLMRTPGAMPSPDQCIEEQPPGTKQFALSPTGRICNSIYDVMHFNVSVEVDARQFRTFLVALTRNRFIGIRSIDVLGVDRDKGQARGYVYGKDPVVQLTIKCETVFFRDWTVKWMPPAVQMLLRVPPPADGPVAAGQ